MTAKPTGCSPHEGPKCAAFRQRRAQFERSPAKDSLSKRENVDSGSLSVAADSVARPSVELREPDGILTSAAAVPVVDVTDIVVVSERRDRRDRD
jgi:hypothetical protein